MLAVWHAKHAIVTGHISETILSDGNTNRWRFGLQWDQVLRLQMTTVWWCICRPVDNINMSLSRSRGLELEVHPTDGIRCKQFYSTIVLWSFGCKTATPGSCWDDELYTNTYIQHTHYVTKHVALKVWLQMVNMKQHDNKALDLSTTRCEAGIFLVIYNGLMPSRKYENVMVTILVVIQWHNTVVMLWRIRIFGSTVEYKIRRVSKINDIF